MAKDSNVSAATREAWRSICIAHGVRCFCTRSWKFFLPLFLSKSCGGSLRPTAAMTLAHNLAVATLSTTAAHVYRTRHPNISVSFFRAMLLENVMLVGLGILMSLFGFYAAAESNREMCEMPFASPLFGWAILFGCIDAVCFNLLSTVICKEWVAALYYKKNEGDLAAANARLTQIDLVTASMCRIFVSTIVQLAGYKMVVIILVVQHAVGALVIHANIKRALTLQPHLAFGSAVRAKESSLLKKPSAFQINPFSIFFDETIPRRSKLMTIAYVLLYCTVLSPGAVLNAWLNSRVSARTIAWFGSSANLLGALATLLTPPLIAMFDKYRVCVLAQFFQCACVMIAAYSFNHIMNSAGSSDGAQQDDKADSWLFVCGFLVPLALSRIGFWAFDLSERQIMQGTIPRDKQTLYLTTERGLTQLVSLSMMCLCYVFSDPASFGILVNISATSVASASLMLGIFQAMG